jgi:hypothetical protein
MVHAALLLLMLGAVTTDLVSPSALKRSTQNRSAIHKLPADYPIFGAAFGESGRSSDEPKTPLLTDAVEKSADGSDIAPGGSIRGFCPATHCTGAGRSADAGNRR